MRTNPNSGSWENRVAMIGLALICFSGHLSGHVLVSSSPSPSIRRLAAIFSGNFSNEEQVQEEIANGQAPHDSFVFLNYPIKLSLFGGENETFYIEGNINGHVSTRKIFVFGQDQNGLIRFRIYNLTIDFPKSPWSVDMSSLQNLTMNDLDYMEGCDPTYYETGEGYFLGKFPQCDLYPPESNVYFIDLFACSRMLFIDPAKFSDQGPYVLKALTRYKLQTYSYEGAGKKELCQGKYKE